MTEFLSFFVVRIVMGYGSTNTLIGECYFRYYRVLGLGLDDSK